MTTSEGWSSFETDPEVFDQWDAGEFAEAVRDRPLMCHWQAPFDFVRSIGVELSGERHLNRVVVSMLAEAALAAEEGRSVSYSRRKANYAGADRICGKGFTYSNVLQAIDRLKAGGWIVERRSHPGQRGWQSSFRATEQLVEALRGAPLDYHLHGLIRMRDLDRNLVAPPETGQTAALRQEVEALNRFLRDIRFEVPEGHGIEAIGHHLRIQGAIYRPTTTEVYRMFGRGRLSMGGRAYWWGQGLPKGIRAQCTMNGERVLEPDFRQMHAAILYAERGLVPPADAYETDVAPRDAGKVAFQVLVNAKGGRSGSLAALRNKRGLRREDGTPLWGHDERETGRLLDALLKKHTPIHDLLGRDQGIRLMRTDSDIAIGTLKLAVRASIPVLPVHDSMMTPAAKADVVADFMEESAARRLRSASPCALRVSRPTVPQMPFSLPLSPVLFSEPAFGVGPNFEASGLQFDVVEVAPANDTRRVVLIPDGVVQPDLFDALGPAALDPGETFVGGVMPEWLIRRVRLRQRELGLRQEDVAHVFGLSRPQVANGLQQRFGIGREAAGRMMAWLDQAA